MTDFVAAYRAALGKLVSEATYIQTREQGIVPVFTTDPQSILEPYVREFFKSAIESSIQINDLRACGLNGYVWEYELLTEMYKAAIHESESENESVFESDNHDSDHDSEYDTE